MSEQIKIFHISDLHYGVEDEGKQRALKDDAQSEKPDLICLTGDIVNFPRPRNFKTARMFISELADGAKCCCVPGNHDAFFGKWGIWQYRRYIDTDLDYVRQWEIKGRTVCVFGVNSTWPSLSNLMNSGHVSTKRLRVFEENSARMEKELGGSGYSDAIKLVLLHHHPRPTIFNFGEGTTVFGGSRCVTSGTVGTRQTK